MNVRVGGEELIRLITAYTIKQSKTLVLLALVLFLCPSIISQAYASAIARVPDEQEKKLVQDANKNLVIVVDSSNPINVLSKKEVIDIFMGLGPGDRLPRWQFYQTTFLHAFSRSKRKENKCVLV